MRRAAVISSRTETKIFHHGWRDFSAIGVWLSGTPLSFPPLGGFVVVSDLLSPPTVLVTKERSDSLSRLSRCKSVRMSEACWYRRFRSFSNALLMISSNFRERLGFNRTGGTGSRFRIASNIAAALSSRNGSCPVAISYRTTPKENKSVRASSALKFLPETVARDPQALARFRREAE